MATRVKRSGTAAKGSTSKAGTGAKGAAKPASKNGSAASKRGELAAKLAKESGAIAKRLAAGGKMKAEKERYGVSDDGPIRKALAIAGFTSKGAKLELGPAINVGTAAGKKALVKARSEGEAWYLLELRSDKTEAELRKIVEEAGGPTGRVYASKGEGSGGGR